MSSHSWFEGGLEEWLNNGVKKSKVSQKLQPKIKHVRTFSLFATQPKNMLKESISESQVSRNMDMFDSNTMKPSVAKPKTLKNKISLIKKKTGALKESKLQKKMRILEQKKRKKEVQEKLRVLNLQRKQFRKYLVCMHILKQGLLKLSYHFYLKRAKSTKKASSKRKKSPSNRKHHLLTPNSKKLGNPQKLRSKSPNLHRKGNRNLSSNRGKEAKQEKEQQNNCKTQKLRILLPTHMIKDLKEDFTENDIGSDRLREFTQAKSGVKSFIPGTELKSVHFSSRKKIDSIDEQMSEEEQESSSEDLIPEKSGRDSKQSKKSSNRAAKTKGYKFPLAIVNSAQNSPKKHKRTPTYDKPPLGLNSQSKNLILPMVSSKESLKTGTPKTTKSGSFSKIKVMNKVKLFAKKLKGNKGKHPQEEREVAKPLKLDTKEEMKKLSLRGPRKNKLRNLGVLKSTGTLVSRIQ